MSKTKLLDSGETTLRPRARIIQAIGEDLISSEVIALVELIKNSYDACAKTVTIEFESPLERGQGSIAVIDDGHGMTLDVLRRAWFEPATDEKPRNAVSRCGRPMTGEKGIGRFAAARLADRMKVESVTENPPRMVVATLDWSDFRARKKYLDEIRCNWEEHSVQPGTPPGTKLELQGLRDPWQRKTLARLRSQLARVTLSSRREDPFIIELKLPSAYEALAGTIDPPEVLLHPHYSFLGTVTAEGHLRGTLTVLGSSRSIDQVIVVEGGRPPCCGPFEFDLKVWDRDREGLEPLAKTLESKVADLRRDLNEACGVSIYRDAFRVLPYGSPEDDWLRLDLRRVNMPTMKLSNNQIVGAVRITGNANPELRDQTNREGLVESEALEDLKLCVLEAIVRMESVRQDARKGNRSLRQHSSLFDGLSLDPVRERFKSKYPQDREFQAFLTKQAETAQSSIKAVQEVIGRYRRLATLGQLIDIVLHEGRTPLSSISSQCTLAARDAQRAQDLATLRTGLSARLEVVSTQTMRLSDLFTRLERLGGRKRGRPMKTTIEEIIRDTFSLFKKQIDDHGVVVTLPSTETAVTLDPGEMQQILTNLLDNSLYWLQRVPKGKRSILVECKVEDGALELMFSDSGPGVSADDAELIFLPYFSTKPNGVGIGLTIAGEIATEYGGKLELMTAGSLPGASFKVILKERVAAPSGQG